MRYIFFILLVITSSAFAEHYEFPCNGKIQFKFFDNIRVRIDRNCGIDIARRYGFNEEGRTRSWSFYKNGLVMVFVSTNDSEYLSRATGSETFHLLPFEEQDKVVVQKLDGGIWGIMTAGSHQVFYDEKEHDVFRIQGFNLTVKSLEHISQIAKKYGLIRIKPEANSENIALRYGWRTGEVAYSQLGRRVYAYKDSRSCKLYMSQFWTPRPAERDEVDFKFSESDEAVSYINQKCFNL